MKMILKSLVAAVLGASGSAAIADYPVKPVTLVVPFAAGGPSDKIARDLAEALREPLGVAVVVENAGGAGGTIGSARVARAAPDGYTLLVHHIGMATAPTLYHKLSSKVPGPEDFEMLGLINEAPSVVIGKTTLAPNSFNELRGWLKDNASKVNLAHAGLGSASHLCGLMLQNALNQKLTAVPYKGTAPAMTDLMGGSVDLMCEQATNAVPQIEGKRVKVYGVTSTQRLSIPALRGTPTLDEAGLKGFNVQVWHGLYAPKGTPSAVLSKLNTALRTALKGPQLIQRQEALGLTVVSDDRLSPSGHRKFVEQETMRWAKVIQEAGEYAE
ncbi:tripartite tricarboxylate transporter substrate-binding protein [uncultured Pigmentiphaga sp.]|uniref:tripartite tricarboxylate transporter substrate-binding protein n=1 Tax=uncultured Pigmentiphaga sp. TaxID=340361 RepID=UPI002622654A|nr:tripartite tricarboxylate transporter substrate-binding protein [uncultured Pigmentiphaga sp.]